MRAANFDVDQLIQYLQGSCKTLEEAIRDSYDMSEGDLTEQDTDKIDSEIFLCSTCGWWCEISEMKLDSSDEQICGDCCEEDYED